MHGLHVTTGVLWGLCMLLQLGAFGLDDRVKVNLLRLGLFWHFLDVVWVAIFSVVYLQGLMQ
jgi:cytochrome o ubiquinol oxidase subunit 3